MSKTNFQIAIDGPVAAGKSTVARKVAEALGFTYIDTGAIYRALTLDALRKNTNVKNEMELVNLAKESKIDVRVPNENERDGRLSTVTLNNEDVSWEIRKGEVTKNVPIVASYPKVREVLVTMQQQIAQGKNVVMEGRDITYVVLPEADLKIYLDANHEVRTDRYFASRSAQKADLTMEQVADWLKERDYTDKNRTASPLKIVPGVWVLDSSQLTIDQVVDLIAAKAKSIML